MQPSQYPRYNVNVQYVKKQGMEDMSTIKLRPMLG